MMEICAAVEKQFTDTLGFNTAAIGRSGIKRIVREAMKRSGISDPAAYLELLSTSPEEFERCLEKLVVPETWFFRDREPFILLKQSVCGQWLPSHPNETVRILSVPCSTGEEPYSIAITLLESGILPLRFRLDAADISRKALDAAGRAMYGKGAFRQPLTAAQETFFSETSTGRRLDEAVVRTVHFYRANIIDPLFFSGHEPYHIIFSRNVLIYLTEDARRLALANIGRLLAPGGILFTGHAEVGILLQQGFQAVSHARAFACTRIEDMMPYRVPNPGFQICPRHTITVKVPERPAAPPGPPPTKRPPSTAVIRETVAPIPAPQTATVGTLHTEALALADRGLFDEAAALCRQYLQEQNPHADVYCLLGLIHEAARRTREAEECYLKALYLGPDHYETLIHLSLLYRQQGDDRKAALYRQRAEAGERRPDGTIGP
jgi:chemotaxis protein methyltransferase WspC